MPASLTFTKVLDAPFLYGGCGLKGICCTGGGHMIAILEEIGGPNGTFPQRVFRSANNGASWGEMPTYFSKENTWIWRAIGTALQSAIVGTSGPHYDNAREEDDGAARTASDGAAWSRGVTPGVFDVPDSGDFWDLNSFARMDDDTIWAGGSGIARGSAFNLMRANPGQLLAGPRLLAPSVTGLRAGAYCELDTICFCSDEAGGGRVWRSMDRGTTWSPVNLPGAPPPSLNGLAYLGQGVILVCGGNGYLVRSDDRGATWGFPGGIPGLGVPEPLPPGGASFVDVVSLGSGVACLAMTGKGNTFNGSNFRMSDDFGLTWTHPGSQAYTNGDAETFGVVFMAAAEDGSVLATCFQQGISSTFRNEIWRGAASGFTGVSLCNAFGTGDGNGGIGAGLAGRPLSCLSAFPPAPCPQECN